MLRKALISAAASMLFTGLAYAGLVGAPPTGFAVTGSWTDFELQTGGRISSDLTDWKQGSNPIPPGNLDNGEIKDLTIASLGALVSSGSAGTLFTGSNAQGRRAVNDDGSDNASGVFIEAGGSPSYFEMTFANAIKAFSFWGTDIGDFGQNCTDGCTGNNAAAVFRVEIFSGVDSIAVLDMSGTATNSSADFYGILTENISFDRVKISNLTTVDGQGFSRMTTASSSDIRDSNDNPVPVPGTLLLVAAGLLALGGRVKF